MANHIEDYPAIGNCETMCKEERLLAILDPLPPQIMALIKGLNDRFWAQRGRSTEPYASHHSQERLPLLFGHHPTVRLVGRHKTKDFAFSEASVRGWLRSLARSVLNVTGNDVLQAEYRG
jgi:hypothetical protein